MFFQLLRRDETKLNKTDVMRPDAVAPRTQARQFLERVGLKNQSLATAAVLLSGLTTISLSQTNREASVAHFQPLGDADKNAIAHFNVLL
jgi:hypothetical protein